MRVSLSHVPASLLLDSSRLFVYEFLSFACCLVSRVCTQLDGLYTSLAYGSSVSAAFMAGISSGQSSFSTAGFMPFMLQLDSFQVRTRLTGLRGPNGLDVILRCLV